MARGTTYQHSFKPKKKRPGIHSKSKQSQLKSSKYYSKKYKGQGR